MSNEELASCGRIIDEIDRKIIILLWQRLEEALRAERIKRKMGKPILRLDIEEMRMSQCQSLAIERGVPVQLVTSIFHLIINESCKVQLAQREAAIND